MGSNSYIPEYISASRIVAHGKIESLANGFSLPNKEGFTIYARPKVGAEIATPDIVLSVKCMTDDKAAEIPVRLNEWNKLYLESIAPNADILESVDLYWGAGFNIVKGKGKYYTEPTAVATRYSGEAQALVTAGSGTGVVKYRLNGGEWSDSVPTATNVGVYQVEYKMEASDLYEGVEPKTLRCTIAEKFINDPTIELTPSGFTYNGSPCVPSVVVKDGQRVIPTAEYTVEITNNINAGTANVVIKDNIAGNYEVIGSTTFNIAKAARTISFVSVPSTLDEEETAVIAATPSAGANDGTISYSSSDSDVLSVDGNVVTAVSGGNATLTAAISEGQNYLGASVTHDVVVKGFVALPYIAFTPVEDSTFGFSKAGLSYSLDEGRHWTELAANGTTPTVAAGNKIMWKNNTTLSPTSSDGIGTFTSSKNFDVEGNIMSLLYGDNFVGQTSLNGEDSVFRYLFKDSKVRKAESLVLPAKKVTTNGYVSMFNGCSSLISAPELPATTLESRCYAYMFQYCTSLTTAPTILPAMALTINCYMFMFSGCTSLASAPELPATSLSDFCYENMFSGCTSLTTAPTLPATTLFTSCYDSMFYGCTHLNYVKMLATDISENGCLRDWLNNVSATGTFVKAEGVEIPEGASGIPSGWAVEIAA